jgi:hypothetical protein
MKSLSLFLGSSGALWGQCPWGFLPIVIHQHVSYDILLLLQIIFIDVLMVATKAASNAANGQDALREMAKSAIAKTNKAYVDSGVNVQLRITGADSTPDNSLRLVRCKSLTVADEGLVSLQPKVISSTTSTSIQFWLILNNSCSYCCSLLDDNSPP